MPKIFISHSWEDNDISRKLAEYLRRDGAEVWIDYARIEGGDSLPKIISDAIDWCDTLVLIWSKSAAASYWVGEEWTCAHVNKKRIIPCIIDNTKLPTILTSRLYLHFSNLERGYRELARTLKLSIKKIDQKDNLLSKDKIPIKTEIKKTEPIIVQGRPEKSDSEKVKQSIKPGTELKFRRKKTGYKKFLIPIAVVFLLIATYLSINYLYKRQSDQFTLSEKEEAPADTTQLNEIILNAEDTSQKKLEPTELKDLQQAEKKINPENGSFVQSSKQKREDEKDKKPKTSPRTPISFNPPEILISRPKFRNEPKALSLQDVKNMLTKYKFFDSEWNQNASGFDNQFETKIINGNSVVIDRASGLMWQQSGSSDWWTYEQANQYIQGLRQNGYAGYKDWRLPTLEEAMSLMEPKKNKDGLYIDPIFDATQSWIWTSDLYQGESRAWVVYFYYGYCYWYGFDYISYYVRAVRSGQSSIE